MLQHAGEGERVARLTLLRHGGLVVPITITGHWSLVTTGHHPAEAHISMQAHAGWRASNCCLTHTLVEAHTAFS